MTATLTVRNVLFQNPPPLYPDPGQLSRVQVGTPQQPAPAAGQPCSLGARQDLARRSDWGRHRRVDRAASARRAGRGSNGPAARPLGHAGILLGNRRPAGRGPPDAGNRLRQRASGLELSRLAGAVPGAHRYRRPAAVDRQPAVFGCGGHARPLLVFVDGLSNLDAAGAERPARRRTARNDRATRRWRVAGCPRRPPAGRPERVRARAARQRSAVQPARIRNRRHAGRHGYGVRVAVL